MFSIVRRNFGIVRLEIGHCSLGHECYWYRKQVFNWLKAFVASGMTS